MNHLLLFAFFFFKGKDQDVVGKDGISSFSDFSVDKEFSFGNY